MLGEATNVSKYDRVASFYDALSRLYSFGYIDACKRFQVDHLINPREKVLFAGAGGGYDVARANHRGAEVTVVELSGRMLQRTRQRIAAMPGSPQPEMIQGDIMAHDKPASYDLVVANFFLNVFDGQTMPRVLQHLTRQVKPGGRLLIADFSPPEGSLWRRLLQLIYWNFAAGFFRLFANNAIHPIYDYRQFTDGLGLQFNLQRKFGFFYTLELIKTQSSDTNQQPESTAVSC